MNKSVDDTDSLVESQHSRLGSFLIASSFLVAAFIQVITAETTNVNDLLVHAIALLGGFLATLYFFMNLWLIMPGWIAKWIKGHDSASTPPHLVHTWIIPLAFIVFWSITWFSYTNLSWTIPLYLFLGFILSFCLFEKFFRKLLKF